MESIVVGVILLALVLLCIIVILIYPIVPTVSISGSLHKVGRLNFGISKSSLIGFSKGESYDPETYNWHTMYLDLDDSVKVLGVDSRTDDWVVELLPRDESYSTEPDTSALGVVFRLAKGELKHWADEIRKRKDRKARKAVLAEEKKAEKIASLESNAYDQKEWLPQELAGLSGRTLFVNGQPFQDDREAQLWADYTKDV